MAPTRRRFLVTAGSALAALACSTRERDAGTASPSADRGPGDSVGGGEPWFLFIGTYTKGGTSRGIYHVTVEPHTLAFGEAVLAAASTDPSFLAFTPDRRTLLAVNELLKYDGESTGTITAYRHETRDGTRHTLDAIDPARATRGAAPCYVTVDRQGRYALVANYMGGDVSVLPIAADGSVGESVHVVMHKGTGPNAARQEAPHAHCIVLDAANRFAIAADLGADRLFVYAFDASTGKLTPADTAAVALKPGAGPRHLAFSPDGRTLYCACELDSTLAVFAYDAATGTLSPRQTLSTRTPAASVENTVADVHVHPNGRTVYVSNRGDNTIVGFSVDAKSGLLTMTQTIPSGGDWPRNFTLTPDGQGLLVAHQKSDSVIAFRIDASTGLLKNTGHVLTAPVPVCLLFA